MTLSDLYKKTHEHVKAHNWGAYPYEHYELLSLLVRLAKPNVILELGTAIGLSAISMAKGNPDSMIDTIEKSRENIEEAKKYAKSFGVINQINFIEGAFLDVVPALNKEYDLIFFDGFAPHLEMLITLEDILRSGGVMVFANLNIGDESEACKQRFQESEIYSHQFLFEDTAIGIKV